MSTGHDTPPDGTPPPPAQPPAREPTPAPVRVPPPAEAVEMGGEAPCQLPRFWDVEE